MRLLLSIALAGQCMLGASSAYSQQFRIDTLFTGPSVAFPVAIAFPPDGSRRMFFTEKNTGNVRIARNDSLLTAPFVTVSVTGSGEQGLLGICFHPNYPDSPFVYLYYTRSGDRANQVVRYRDVGGLGTNPEVLLVVPRVNTATNHNGGNIHFGPDGKLYVSIGDYATSSNSQDTSNSNKRGKIHRLNSDGSIPSDNPLPGNSIYAYGLRNSFDFTFDAATGKCYASENGPACNDEINYILPGMNYGWPIEGNCTYTNDPRYKRPIYYWPTNLPAVTGILVYRGSAFPELQGKLLVANSNFGSVHQFTLAQNGDSVTGPPTTLLSFGSGLNDIETGPDGYIYITNGTYGGTSRIIRLRPILQPPGSTSLVSPADSAIINADSVRLVWRAIQGATSYWLELAIHPNFTVLALRDTAITDTSRVVRGLLNEVDYFWRVRARNSAGTGSFSPVRWFRIVLTSVEPDDRLPGNIKLFQNYPNPFNPVTNFQFSIPNPQFVSITIHDILGREVATLVSEEKPAGSYEIAWRADGFPSGVYYCTLQADGTRTVRKALLLK